MPPPFSQLLEGTRWRIIRFSLPAGPQFHWRKLRRLSREAAAIHERLCNTTPETSKTLLVNSKMRGHAVLHMKFGIQRAPVHSSGETHFHGVGDWPPQINQQSHPIFYSSSQLFALLFSIRQVVGRLDLMPDLFTEVSAGQPVRSVVYMKSHEVIER
jgi:hypothetical protein